MNTDSMTSLRHCHTPAAQSLHTTWVRLGFTKSSYDKNMILQAHGEKPLDSVLHIETKSTLCQTLRLIGSLSRAASMSSSLSKTLAGPLN